MKQFIRLGVAVIVFRLFTISGLAEPIEVGTPVEFQPGVAEAAELTFQSQAGVHYQLEVSADLVDWDKEGYAVKGTGGEMTIYASTRRLEQVFYRLRNDGDPNQTAPSGPQGPAGPQGPVGPIGDMGLTGMGGLTGPAGPAGPQGVQGLVGPQGVQGPTGPAGEVQGDGTGIDDGPAFRSKLLVDQYEDIRRFGASPSADPGVNDAALAAAYEAANLKGRVIYIPSGTFRISKAWRISGASIRIQGAPGSVLLQTNPMAHGIELDPERWFYGITIEGLTLRGQGAATHLRSAVHFRRSDNGYCGSDLNLTTVTIEKFEKGMELRGLVHLVCNDVSVVGCKIGGYWDKVDTYSWTAGRVTGGTFGALPAGSRCFVLTGGTFGGTISGGGEFGGIHIEQFAEVLHGRLFVEGSNFENFTSPVFIDVGDYSGNAVSLTRSRISIAGFTSSSAFISAKVTGNGVPAVEFHSNTGISAGRAVEVWGGTGDSPIIMGAPVLVTFAQGRNGAADRSMMVMPGRSYAGLASLPLASSPRGTLMMLSGRDTRPDSHLDALIMQSFNQKTGKLEKSSLVNDQLLKVLGTGSKTTVSGPGEAVLSRTTVPPHSFSNAGESLSFRAFGVTGANANNKRWRLKVGDEVLFDSGEIPANGETWILEAELQRSTEGLRVLTELRSSTGSTIGSRIGTGLSTAVLSSSIQLDLLGQGGEAEDLVMHASKAAWLRAISDLR